MTDAALTQSEHLLKKPMNGVKSPAGRVGRSVLASFIASLGSMSFGFGLGYSSSALEDLQNLDDKSSVHLTAAQGSWFSSLMTLGAIFGSLLGGWAIDKIGRKSTIVLCVIPFDLGWLLIAYAKNREMLYAGRVISGLGVGIIALAVPVYIAELVSARLRGMLTSVSQVAVSFGILFGFVWGAVFNYSWLAFIGTIPPTLAAIFMYWMPETPRWLMGNNRRSEALEALLWLRGTEADILEECNEIEATLETHEKLRCKEMLTPAIAKPLILSVGVLIFQQFNGVNAVLFNAATIFADAGFDKAKLVTISIGLVQLFGTLLSCFLVDKVGRRILLWATALLMCVSLVALGVYFEIYIPPEKASSSDNESVGSISHSVAAHKISWLSILSLILFNLGFSLAWGGVPWLVNSELNPMRSRGPASSIGGLSNWLSCFVVTKTFENLQQELTDAGVYWFYAGWCFLAFLFVFFFLPETKGKTLEEIEAFFDKKRDSYQAID